MSLSSLLATWCCEGMGNVVERTMCAMNYQTANALRMTTRKGKGIMERIDGLITQQPKGEIMIGREQVLATLHMASGALELARDELAIANRADVVFLSKEDMEQLNYMVKYLNGLYEQFVKTDDHVND